MVSFSSVSLFLLAAGFALLASTDAFVTPSSKRSMGPLAATNGPKEEKKNGFLAGIGNFFEELDAFMDDASARRLGAGATFYGKRRSKFYGSQDKWRKADKNVADPTEDYQGPTSTGLFKWMADENGQLRPVTRGRNQIIERSPSFWDRYYAKKEEER